jgi:hypothetical protein
MARPERALDPATGPLEHFACELRQLRQEAGPLSYRDLARTTRYSASALSRAASGRELPSLAVTLAYVRACGGDEAAWEARWRSLATEPAAPLAAPEPTAVPGSTAPPAPAAPAPSLTPAPSARRRRLVIAGGLLAAVVAALVTAAYVTADPGTGTGAHTGTGAWHPPQDGMDPIAAGCTRDDVTIAVASIRVSTDVTASGHQFPEGTVIGTVELRYSARCEAAWARVVPTPAFDYPLSGKEELGVQRPADQTGSNWRPGRVEEAYSDLLLTKPGCVQAFAKFYIADGHQADATTACRGGTLPG